MLSNNYKKKLNVSSEIIFVLLIIFCLFSLSCDLKSQQKSKTNKNLPKGNNNINVLLISIDTLRADHLGCYGYPRPVSPNIDQLAQDGILFNSAYTASNWTLPSHATIMTGLYPFTHMVLGQNSALSAKQPTLAQILSKNEYLTAAFTAGGWVSSGFGFHYGFNSGYYEEKESFKADVKNTTFNALDWMEKNYQSKFFLFFHTYQVHQPFKLDKTWINIFCEKPINVDPKKVGEFTRKWDQNGELIEDYFSEALLAQFLGIGDPISLAKPSWDDKVRDFIEKKWINRPEYKSTLKNIIDLYDCSICYTDFWLGKIIDRLKEYGIYDKTMIILLSDHGEEFMEHGRLSHGQDHAYNELMHIPLIIKLPENKITGTLIQDEVSTVDIFPSILYEINRSLKFNCEGRNLFNNEDRSKQNFPVFFELTALNSKAKGDYGIIGVIYNDFKYFSYFDNGLEDKIIASELYNLKQDARENLNLIDYNYPVKKELAELLNNFQDHFKSQQPAVELAKPDDHALDQLRALGYIE